MNIGIKKSSNLHNSVSFRRIDTIFKPACSGEKSASYGAIIVCVDPVPISLPSGAHMHLGPEAQ
jgi:hypothetical protein